MKKEILSILLLAVLIIPMALAVGKPAVANDYEEQGFFIENIHLSDGYLVWSTTEPSMSSAEIYYFANPGIDRLFSMPCSKQHSQQVDDGDDDLYFQIQATSCLSEETIFSGWLWIYR